MEQREINPRLFNKLRREMQRKVIALTTRGVVNDSKVKTRKVRFSKLKAKDISFEF